MDVDILLATYNGEKFLKEQIDSILNQTYPHFNLLIRDDGSTDRTLEIIKSYEDPRIKLLDNRENGGVVKNFSSLLQASFAPYVLLCDQDDVWSLDKIERLVVIAQAFDEGRPLLVHHDMEVVDSDLKMISPSFWEYSKFNPLATSLNRLLMQNNVTGAACLINHALIEKALPIPQEALMHDHWLALIASAFGDVIPVKEVMMKYRQHGKNQLGAKKQGVISYLNKGLKKLGKAPFALNQEQARAFITRFYNQLDDQNKTLLDTFTSLSEVSYLKSRYLIVKSRFWKQGWLKNFTLIITPYESSTRP